MINTIEKKGFVASNEISEEFPNMLIGKEYRAMVVWIYHVSTYEYNNCLLSEYHFELLGYDDIRFIAVIPTPQFESNIWYDLIINRNREWNKNIIKFTLTESNKIYPQYKLAYIKPALSILK